MNYFPKCLRKFIYHNLLLLHKYKISEPLLSVKFILLKSYGMSLCNYNNFYNNKNIIKNFGRFDKNKKFKFLNYLIKRLKDYPIQYILGEWHYRDFIVKCNSPVLIPRIETEMIVDLVKREIDNNLKLKKLNFLEIGIGSGIIFISILREIKNINCVGIDIDHKCVDLSIINSENLLPLKIQKNIKILNNDFINYAKSFCDSKFDFIVSNPPYIKSDDNRVMQDVIKYESHKALFSDEDGLGLIKEIIKNSRKLVKKGGFVILEIDPDQQNKIINILVKDKYFYFLFENDIFDRCRFVIYYVN